MATLYILAGPNGTGKTTWYFAAREQNFINLNLSFENIDLITLNELGGYNPKNLIHAEMLFRERIGKHIENKEDFMIESNLAKESDYNWIDSMSKAGYEIILLFLCTDDLNIHINRVARRVKEGGHDIPENIIVQRYKMSLIYLKTKLHLFKEIFLIDNSETQPQLVAKIINGKLEEQVNVLPRWAENILFFLKRGK